MKRSGISFTLTLVVAGVILLMTALSVITLGGSSIQSFFQTTGEQKQEAVQDSAIREACNRLKTEITNNYCDMYVARGTLSHAETNSTQGFNCQDGALTAPAASEQCNNAGGGSGDGTPDDALTVTDDEYTADLRSSANCGQTVDTRQPYTGPDDPTESQIHSFLSNTGAGTGESVTVASQTASEAGCNWADNYYSGLGNSPTVTVQGEQFNCLERGYLDPDQTCPVQ